jgi:hypothetical protein
MAALRCRIGHYPAAGHGGFIRVFPVRVRFVPKHQFEISVTRIRRTVVSGASFSIADRRFSIQANGNARVAIDHRKSAV